jgi:hypothetical protein
LNDGRNKTHLLFFEYTEKRDPSPIMFASLVFCIMKLSRLYFLSKTPQRGLIEKRRHNKA